MIDKGCEAVELDVLSLYGYHYYEKSIGPFRNLSDLTSEDADKVMEDLRKKPNYFASKRSDNYMSIRRELELKAHVMFLEKGGRPTRTVPHYMTLMKSSWVKSWYETGQELKIALREFDKKTISFTYGDLFPTMRYDDGKEYRGKIYRLAELGELINKYGFPQRWNSEGNLSPERYIEIQIWSDDVIGRYINEY